MVIVSVRGEWRRPDELQLEGLGIGSIIQSNPVTALGAVVVLALAYARGLSRGTRSRATRGTPERLGIRPCPLARPSPVPPSDIRRSARCQAVLPLRTQSRGPRGSSASSARRAT